MTSLIFTSSIYGKVAFIPYPVADGATEALEFFTDVLASYTNKAEERNQMRAIPRQSFEYTYKASIEYQQAIYNAAYANLRAKWLIPLWFEAQAVKVVAGDTTVNVDTLIHDIRANTHVLIFKSICDWQVLTVSAITDTTMTCNALAFGGNAFVIPFRVGFVTGQAGMSPTGYNNAIKLKYQVDDVLTGLTETVDQYNGFDLYTVPYLRDDTATTQVNWDEDNLDFSTGNIAHTTAWGGSQYSKQYMFADVGQDNLRKLKNYFYRRAGKFRPFYSPSFESNLQSLHTGNVGTLFKFRDEGYTDNLFAIKKRLAFALTDGTWQIRTVTSSIHVETGVDQLTLDTALNVNANRIAYVSFLDLNRLDTDRIEITLGTASQFRTSANVIEVPA